MTKVLREEKRQRGCDICGYNKCASALEWHHPNGDKTYNPAELYHNLHLYREETSKCQLLCANCHRELHEQKEEAKYVWPVPDNNKSSLTEDEVIAVYQETKSCRKVAELLQIDASTVSNICKKHNIVLDPNHNSRKKIAQIDKNTNSTIRIFDSISDALVFLKKKPEATSHISAVCKGKRKTAYGYKWKYI